MCNYCVIAESDRYFQTSSCTIMIQNESLKRFFSTSRRRVVKNLLGQVLNHYRTGTSLKISVGRQDHTVNALLFNFCKFDPKKSRENANCTIMISKLYNNVYLLKGRGGGIGFYISSETSGNGSIRVIH